MSVETEMRALRLMALTTSREEGGAESHLLTTLRAVRADGYEVEVALPRSAQTSQLWDELRDAGCQVHGVSLGRQTRSKVAAYLAIVHDTLACLWLIVRLRPDAVLLNLSTPEATPGAMVSCALARVPTTAIFHLVRSDLRVTRLRRRLYRRLALTSQAWICVSRANRATLADQFGVARERIAVVRNGATHRTVARERREQTRADLDVPHDATLVLTTGRLGEQKGHRVIVEALPRLVALDARLVFVWAGDGPLRAELAGAVSSAGLERHVRVLGRRDDVPELLAAADLFLMPSRDEGAPLALVEAMLAGVPAIVSNAGALTETIEDRRNGVVFVRDDADDLVRAIEWSLGHGEQLAQMAAHGRELALQEFTVERMLAQLMPYLIARARPRSRA